MPSEDYSQQEAAKALTRCEGRWERDGNHQKKAMKTKSQNTKPAPGLRVQSSNHQETPATAEQTPERQKLPAINFKRRKVNRSLNTESVLSLLREEAPSFFAVAEVVGKWIWIQFTEKQPREVTAALAELGFHWNNFRQTWQHPCGTLAERSVFDPRKKYGSSFPARA